MAKIIKTKNEKETIKAAATFARKLKGGEIVALTGDLGAGKTVWVRGMAKALGIRETINSPTFVLMKCFSLKQRGIRNFCHVDAYRLKDSSELSAIGLEDYLDEPDTVTVIEWAERAEKILKNRKKIEIRINFGEKEDERVIGVS